MPSHVWLWFICFFFFFFFFLFGDLALLQHLIPIAPEPTKQQQQLPAQPWCVLAMHDSITDDLIDLNLCIGVKEYNGSSAIVTYENQPVTSQVLPVAPQLNPTQCTSWQAVGICMQNSVPLNGVATGEGGNPVKVC
jgi:hypothetical protein